MLKSIALIALLGGRVYGASGPVNYAQLGKDWPTDTDIKDNKCGGDYQSPIDLKTDLDKIKHADENFFKHYEDLSSNTFYQYKNTWLKDPYTT